MLVHLVVAALLLLPGVATDVVVFGATPAGVGAALSAAAQGRNVTLLEQQQHVGGMMSGGLGWDDVDCSYCPTDGAGSSSVPSRSVFGESVYWHFAAGVREHYRGVSARALELSVNGTRHEPHVAEQVMLAMLSEANVTVRLGLRLSSVTVQGERIRSVHVQPTTGDSNSPAQTVAGSVFIDASYEGDLLAQAGAPWTVGREGRMEYGELSAGVVFQDNVQHDFLRGSTGEPSPSVPAMTWRLCFSTSATRKLMTAPPPNYNRSLYLGYVDDVAAKRIESVWNAWSGPRALPPDGTKYDINCNPRPLGFVWAGDRKDEYVNATHTRRAQLLLELREITLGLLWFQQHDSAVPAAARAEHMKHGLCADEFADEGYFPRQLYIREARRLDGRSRLTEHDLVPTVPDGRPPLLRDALAVGSFAIDSFPCTTAMPAVEQRSNATALEGYIGMESQLIAPSTLPAAIMLPYPGVAAPRNLIVPTAVSASHVAFSAVRLEPTWMMLGSAAGTIAHLSLLPSSSGVRVQQRKDNGVVDVDLAHVRLVAMQRLVVARGQPLVYFSDCVVGDPGWEELQLLAPGAFWAADGFAADPAGSLSRATAVHWIAAALQAANSTLGWLAPTGALLPDPVPNSFWSDFRAGDPGFHAAASLATVGAVTPDPGPGVQFLPHEPVSLEDLQAWARAAATLLPTPGHESPASEKKSAAADDDDVSRTSKPTTRSQGAVIVVESLMGGRFVGSSVH
jgi:hypothetical protein